MHIDALTLPEGATLDGDLCIVGAGAAGIAMALEFIGRPERVLLLEGGGFDLEPQMQALYRGEIVGRPYYPLEAARLHYFGGTTGHWGGFCAPLDNIDFEQRPWVPHSGWPITRAQLDPFYARAQRTLQLGPYEYDAAYWQQRDARLQRLPLDPTVVREKMWQFSPPSRFGTLYREPIVSAPNIHLYTHANVCEIDVNDSVSAVESLSIRQNDGRTQRVRATRFVLACSTLQNVRLLLASNRHATAGVGNAHDQVGRYFMEHLEMAAGNAIILRPQSLQLYALDWGVTKARAELALTDRVQRELGLLNATIAIEPAPKSGEAKNTFELEPPESLESFRRDTPNGLTADMLAEAAKTPPHDSASVVRQPFFALVTRQEQAPNPNSRITLSTERDALGVPRVRFDWQLSSLDKRTMRSSFRALGEEFGRRGVGRVQLRDWLLSGDTIWPDSLSGGWHHMGATRMHADPTQGVVDASCQVHGIGNLFVTGGGVFPTAGSANPTLTIVALALRLADHLKHTRV